jgi:small subunit ribosomal protein S9
MLLRRIFKNAKLSLERALFLAKEAGIYTTREVQTHIIKSPSFSKSDSPFLTEDFFYSRNPNSELEKLPSRSATTVKEQASSPTPAGAQPESSDNLNDQDFSKANSAVHTMLIKKFQPKQRNFFIGDREFKWESEGRGTKKRATAHVKIVRGSGIIRVNGEEDFWKRWPLYYNRFDVAQPFLMTQTCAEFDVFISVKGGGISGQSCAARLAVARALVDASPSTAPALVNALIEDSRQKVSKMSGRNGAFARDKNKR